MRIVIIFLFFVCSATAQDFERKFREYGLIDIQKSDSTIQVRLPYATTGNFTKQNLYGTLNRAYAQKEIVRMIVKAQQLLKAKHPEWSLLILDAARPMSVQRRMFSIVAGTPLNIYVANPSKGGGRHNYGVAVDATIVDENGEELDMGSPFDHFGEESHTDAAQKNVITPQAAKNRELLIGIMSQVGLTVHPKEWWHFQKYTIAELQKMYRVLDF